MSEERRASHACLWQNLITVSKAEGTEGARDLALSMQSQGVGKCIDFQTLTTRAHIMKPPVRNLVATEGKIT